MKRIFTIFALSIIACNAIAQSPEKMSYQAVIRDASNTLITTTSVGMRISILQGSITGPTVYIETQLPTSNANGVVSAEIGNGTVISGSFSSINWANGPYFVRTETDPNGGSSYTITGTSQLLSVPYALHAKYADHIAQDSTTDYIHSDTINNFIIQQANGKHPFYAFASTNQVYNPISQQFALTGTSKDNHNPLDSNDTRAFIVHNDGQRQLTKTVVCEPGELTISVQNDSLSAINQNPFQAVIQMKDNSKEILIGNAYVSPQQQNVVLIADDATYFYFTDDDDVTSRAFAFDNNGLSLVKNDTTTLFNVDMNGVTNLNEVMNIKPRSTAPSSPQKGTIYFNDTSNKLMVYDGTAWNACW